MKIIKFTRFFFYLVFLTILVPSGFIHASDASSNLKPLCDEFIISGQSQVVSGVFGMQSYSVVNTCELNYSMEDFTFEWSVIGGVPVIPFDEGPTANVMWSCTGDWICYGSISVVVTDEDDDIVYSEVFPVVIYRYVLVDCEIPAVCAGESEVYLALNDPISPYAQFIWSFPYGVTLVEGGGPEDTYAIVDFSMYATGGTISIQQELTPDETLPLSNFNVTPSPLPSPLLAIYGLTSYCSTANKYFATNESSLATSYHWFVNDVLVSTTPNAQSINLGSFISAQGMYILEVKPYNTCGYGTGAQTEIFISPQESTPEQLIDSYEFSATGVPDENEEVNSLFVQHCIQTCSFLQYKRTNAKLLCVVDLGENCNLLNNDTPFSHSISLEFKFYPGTSTTPVHSISVPFTITNQEPEAYFVFEIDDNLFHQFSRVKVFASSVDAVDTGEPPLNDFLRITTKLDMQFIHQVQSTSQLVSAENVTIIPNQNNLTKFEWSTNCNELVFQNYEFQLLRLFNINQGSETNPNSIVCNPEWEHALTIETQSSATEITLNIAEGMGYYAWRVRPIGNWYPGGIANYMNHGQWSTVNGVTNFGASPTQITQNSTDNSVIYLYPLDSERNWIYSRVLTEAEHESNNGAKVFETIQYANGLNMPFQNQSKMNSQEEIIVQEDIADYVGRMALSSLPVPLKQGNIRFVPGFVRNMSNQVYSAADFDANSNLLAPTQVLSTTTPQSYYTTTNSANNNFTIPDAEGFPFSRTIFYPDQSNRPKEQGAPGNILTLKSDPADSRTIKNVYTGVNEQELLRIFGDEAPLGTSVGKTISYDQNRKANVTYSSKEGRVIATCLAITGDAELSPLLPLASQSTALFSVSTLMPEAIQMEPYTTSSFYEFAITGTTDVTIEYVIYPTHFQNECGDICVGCDYSVSIYIVDVNDPGSVYTSSNPEFNPLNIQGDCLTDDFYETFTFTIPLPAGSYQVVKEITTNNWNSLEDISFLNGHLQQLETVFQEQVDVINDLIQDYLVAEEDFEGFYAALVLMNPEYANDPNFVLADMAALMIPIFNEDGSCGYIEVPVQLCPPACPFVLGEDQYDFVMFKEHFENFNSQGELADELANFYGQTNATENLNVFYQMLGNMLAEETVNENNEIVPLYTCEQIWGCWHVIASTYTQLVDMSTGASNYEFSLIPYFLQCVGYEFIGYSSTGIHEEHDGGEIAPLNGSVASGEYGYLTHAYAIVQVSEEGEDIIDDFIENGTDCVFPPESDPNEYPVEHLCLCALLGPNNSDYNNAAISEPPLEFLPPTSVAGFTSDHWQGFHACINSLDPELPASTGGINEMQDACIEMCNNKALAFKTALLNAYHATDTYVQELDVYYVEPNPWMNNGFFTTTDVIDWNNSLSVPLETFNCQLSSILEYCYSNCSFTQVIEDDLVVAVGTPEEVELVSKIFTHSLQVSFPDGNDECPESEPNESEWIHLENDVVVVPPPSTYATRAQFVNYLNFMLNDFYTLIESMNLPIPNPSGPLEQWYTSNYNDEKLTFTWTDIMDFAPILVTPYAARCELTVKIVLDMHGIADPNYDTEVFEFWELSQSAFFAARLESISYYRPLEMGSIPVLKITPNSSSNFLYQIQTLLQANSAQFTDWLGNFELVQPDNKFNFNVEGILQPGCETSYYHSDCSGIGAGSVSSTCTSPTEQNAYLHQLYFLDGHPAWTASCTAMNANIYEDFAIECRDTVECAPICVRWMPMPPFEADTLVQLPCEEVAISIIQNTVNSSSYSLLTELQQELVNSYDTICPNPQYIVDSCVVSYNLGYHHYTLYYYDRAGNLIKTVPPEGVDLLDVTDPLVLARQVHPNHTYETEYYYNSLKQLKRQKTPDGGETFFYYDALGQLRFSQNAQQLSDGIFSYSKYDKLGRIIEIGRAVLGTDDLTDLALLNDATYPLPQSSSEQTFTFYSVPAQVTFLDESQQRFILNRVSYTITSENLATYYSYDPHGNVEWMVYEIPGLGRNYVRYHYDLVSGNVLKVAYNEGKIDQFYHRYHYDADNRITAVETSTDHVVWDKDARYDYYLHGPLQRTLVGEDEVQGLDYVYTLQGWLKGINHPSADVWADPSQDGDVEENETAKDVVGMILNYYDGDFPVTGSNYISTAAGTGAFGPTLTPQNINHSLYNGNIASWVSKTDLSSTGSPWDYPITANLYRYDELHRIKESHFNHFFTSWTATDKYGTDFSYDANGNLETLNRRDQTASLMDELGYTYFLETNKLDKVHDEANSNDLTNDFEGTSYFDYDLNGNLIEDENTADETITRIRWNLQGKVSEVRKEFISTEVGLFIRFLYDANGNRAAKTVITDVDLLDLAEDEFDFDQYNQTTTTTYYVRDAQGNVLTTYKQSFEETEAGLQENYFAIEQSIFGSSRLGLRKYDDKLVKSVLYPNAANPIVTEYGNWIRRTEFQNYPFTLNYNWLYGTLCLPFTYDASDEQFQTMTILELGMMSGSSGVAENQYGEKVFSFYNRNHQGQVNTMVYDKSNVLMWGSENIQCHFDSRSMAMKVPGNNSFYYLFTINNDFHLQYHVIDINGNDGYGTIYQTSNSLGSVGGMTYALSFALFEDHTIPNRSKLYIKRRNALNNTVEYVYFKINDVDQNLVNDNNMLFEEHVFRQTPGSGFSVFEEIQISPDGTRLCAAHNNLGGAIFSFSGTIIQFLLDQNHEPIYEGILATSSTIASYVTHLDFSAASNNVFFVQHPYGQGNSRLNFQDVYGNNLTTFLAETRGAVRRLNDGDLYFKLPNGANGYLAKIVGANGPSPGLSNQLIIEIPPLLNDMMSLTMHYSTQPHRLYPNKGLHPRVVGEKLYELTDHLGNVRTTITDRKIATFDSNWNITGYTADIKSANDYFPFGSEMPGRSYNSGDYRYGFNGKELDTETDTYNYGFRIYNGQLAKFLSVDPLSPNYPMLTPYQYASNNPILNVDIDGLEGVEFGHIWFKEETQMAKKTPEERRRIETQGAIIFLGIAGLVGVAAVAPEVIPYIAQGALFVQSNQLAILGAGSFVIGILDESGQTQIPGPLDESGRFTRLVGNQILKNVRGFSSAQQFENAVSKIIKATGVDDAYVGLRGSSVTGTKFDGGVFDDISDLDFFVVSDDLFKQALDQGAKGKDGALKVGETLKFFPDLVKAEQQLTKELGRKSSIRIFSQEGFKDISKGATEGN